MDDVILSIIDDDGPLRRALDRLMASANYQAFSFEDAENFLSSPQAKTSSLLITDVQLPGLDGFELIAALDELNVRTPVIMITGRTEVGMEARALAAGASCLLRKPFQSERLLHEIVDALATPCRRKIPNTHV